jgi:cytochrome d ubiquinol oxidase subunit II
VPFHYEWDLRSFYTGSFIALLNPFAVMAGLLSLALAIYMGGVMLMGRTDGAVAARSQKAASIAALLAIVLFAIGGFWSGAMDGFVLDKAPNPALAQSPLQQSVSLQPGALHANFYAHPLLWAVPLLGFAGMLLGLLAVRSGKSTLAWWLGALAWIGVIGTVGVSLFPFMMPSSTNPSQSLTLWNSISSQYTLLWMTGFTAVFVPLIIWYTSWAFYIMRGKVDAQAIEQDGHAY